MTRFRGFLGQARMALSTMFFWPQPCTFAKHAFQCIFKISRSQTNFYGAPPNYLLVFVTNINFLYRVETLISLSMAQRDTINK